MARCMQLRSTPTSMPAGVLHCTNAVFDAEIVLKLTLWLTLALTLTLQRRCADLAWL